MHFKLLKKKNRFYEFRQTPPPVFVFFSQNSVFFLLMASLTILFFLDGVESQAPTPGRLVCQKVCTFTASFQLLQACIVWVCLNVVVFWWFWLKSAASASLGSLKTPPTKTSNTTPHYKPKYEILVIAKNCGTISDKLFRQLKLDQTLIRF